MQMGREFGPLALLSLTSLGGSCKQLARNLCFKWQYHTFIIWKNKVFQLHAEINIPEFYGKKINVF